MVQPDKATVRGGFIRLNQYVRKGLAILSGSLHSLSQRLLICLGIKMKQPPPAYPAGKRWHSWPLTAASYTKQLVL